MLIDEIEAAAKRYKLDAEVINETEFEADELVTSSWWPRVRAALLAAQEMDIEISELSQVDSPTMRTDGQRQFREAMGD